MASASVPLQIVDDDDGFDWEAAVHEIDVACQATAAENPTGVAKREMVMNPDQEMRKRGKFEVNFSSASSTRQTTLDKFIGVSSCNSRKFEEKAAFSCWQRMNNSTGNNTWDKNDGGVDGSDENEKFNVFVEIDAEAAKTWIYPVNIPLRDYQLSITRTALFANTLVALPTGLGKTLIAAVVMYNFFRWFPEGKIVFAAPSRPLVMQQIEACHNTVGIPQEWTIDLTGQTSPSRRAEFWKSKRVFFVTPQVLEKDIQSGSLLVKHLVCLVIDEAHRATGNYSYCVAVRELIDASVQLRILALTATPGSKQQTIQNVIDNLQISTLEYRNESDPDVLPFVHERKIELIQVALGREADEINSLLLEVGSPIHARLSSLGLLPKRDIQTLSPCDYLNSREMFCQKPPPGVPPSRHGELMGCFGALITLHHIRKLLTSHGIRPAFEVLDEKLKKGPLARMLGRNEVLLKAKLLMQKTMDHGAPSPKLAKMLDVLIEHFKSKDPKNSRVIIFSNFRGSVRDILDALIGIGELVKATEFIGQSSGKTSKGQTQKVQQAVLQKFRSGGYNVIVATSIGEEGLDIMEVDLVICFDANVSPLRMIQRMGRTGRKHEGRVVVLACEGSELKGYTRKQANSRSITKHMINGGTSSFKFHSSPRMVPHYLKPELQLLEISIKEYVPRGSKAKDSEPLPLPAYKDKFTEAEKDLLAKYFIASQENAWRPSLIAFPHFQACPSPAFDVLHASRTGLLIDTMQHLQDLKYSREDNYSAEDVDIPDPSLGVLEPHDRVNEDSERDTNLAEENFNKETEELARELQETAKDVHTEDPHKLKTWLHTFLFASEFVSVDDVGNVLVLSLPQLPLNSSIKQTEASNVASSYYSIQEHKDHAEIPLQPIDNPSAENEMNFCMAEEIPNTPDSSRMQKEMDISDHDHELDDDATDSELSPRMTNFIKSGVVPESPINDAGTWKSNKGDLMVPALISSPNLETGHFLNSCEQDKQEVTNGSSRGTEILCLNDNGIRTPKPDCFAPVPVTKEVQTPLTKLSNSSNSKDWLLDSVGVEPKSVEQQPKFRRLRKLGELKKKLPTDSGNQNGGAEKSKTSRRSDYHKSTKLKGEKKLSKDIADFIEVEAEVSSDGMASGDEDDVEDGSSYEDSFIDDGVNPTAVNTQSGSGRVDMMAIYRRSLLSQSPFQRLPTFPTNESPDSVVQSSKMDESGSSTGTKHGDAPQTGLDSTARNNQYAGDEAPMDKIESRKRKLNSHQGHSIPMLNLDKKFALLSETVRDNSTARDNLSMHVHVETKVEESIDVFEDDEFYEGIDLDAIEEEATKLLKQKAECSMQKMKGSSSQTIQPNLEILGSPSFDLGI